MRKNLSEYLGAIMAKEFIKAGAQKKCEHVCFRGDFPQDPMGLLTSHRFRWDS